MKNFKLFKLLLLGVVLITSFNTAWAYYYIVGETALTGNNWDWYNPSCSMGTNNTITFMAKAAGKYEFKLYKYVNDGDKWDNLGGSIHSASGTAYDSHGGGGGSNMWIKTNEVANITFTLYGSDQVDITVTKCAYYIKYPWNGGGYAWSGDMKSNGDGTYSVRGQYGGKSYNYGRQNADGGADSGYKTDAIVTDATDPKQGEYCIFTYTPSDHSLRIRRASSASPTNYFYFDNSNAKWSQTYTYFVIGNPEYSTMYGSMNAISNTKLMYGLSSGDTWNDISYYAVAAGNSAWDGEHGWNYPSLTGWTKRSAPYLTKLDMRSGYLYLIGKANGNNDEAITLTEKGNTASSLNSTQTIKYAVATGGTAAASASELTSGTTPAAISISSYKFSNGTYDEVAASSSPAKSMPAGGTTRSMTETAGYTATTAVTVSSINAAYRFKGFYAAASGGSALETGNTYTYYPKAATTVYARFVSLYYVTYNINGGTGTLPTKGTSASESGTNVTLGNNNNSDGNGNISKVGYTLSGWNTKSDGTGVHYDLGGSVSAINESKTLYAEWTPNTLTFNGTVSGSATDWDNTGNWSEACLPTIKHDVIIDKPVVVNITDAKAKSVKIYNDGTNSHTGKLTISAGNALVVAEDIQKTINGSKKIATTADVLHIEAGNTSDANGALVWGTSGTPGAAQVDFFTKSHGVKGDGTSINQYIGTPFSDHQSILYQYYYSWIFKIKRDESTKALSWDLMGGDESMNEFEGYNLITAYDANTTYQMEGTLVSNGNVTLNGSSTPALVWSGSGDQDEPNNENVLANSWVAPIKIKALSGFTDVESSIYIFNACNANDYPFGNYTTYSISLAEDNVIPSMQSFSVYATGENPSITLNYNTIVKSPLSSAYNNSANKAPAHDRADEMDLLKVRIDGENGWADELKIYIHEDFSNAFEDSWDAHKMYGYPEAPQLYALTTDGNMAINCVPTADNNVLGFTSGSENNEYTFSFTYDGDEEYYLKDTKLNIETLINTEATYTFTSEAEDSDMRFIIIKRAPAVATDVETVSGDRLAVSGVQKIMHNGQLYIIRDGEIYDATGTMVK